MIAVITHEIGIWCYYSSSLLLMQCIRNAHTQASLIWIQSRIADRCVFSTKWKSWEVSQDTVKVVIILLPQNVKVAKQTKIDFQSNCIILFHVRVVGSLWLASSPSLPRASYKTTWNWDYRRSSSNGSSSSPSCLQDLSHDVISSHTNKNFLSNVHYCFSLYSDWSFLLPSLLVLPKPQ